MLVLDRRWFSGDFLRKGSEVIRVSVLVKLVLRLHKVFNLGHLDGVVLVSVLARSRISGNSPLSNCFIGKSGLGTVDSPRGHLCLGFHELYRRLVVARTQSLREELELRVVGLLLVRVKGVAVFCPGVVQRSSG